MLRDTITRTNVPLLSSSCYFNCDSAAFLKGIDLKKVVLTAVYSIADNTHEQYSNTFYFVPLKELALERPAITKEIRETQGGFKITLKTDKLAKSVWLSATVSGKFSDNFTDIFPGKPLEIFFTTTTRQKDLLNRIIIRTLYDTY